MTFEADLRNRLLQSITVLHKYHVPITSDEWRRHVDNIVSIVLSGNTKKTGGSLFSVIKKAWEGLKGNVDINNLKVVSKVSKLYSTKLTDYFKSISGGDEKPDEVKKGWSAWAITCTVVTVILVIAAVVLYARSPADIPVIPLNNWGPAIPPPPPPGGDAPLGLAAIEAIIANLPQDYFGPSLWGPAGAGVRLYPGHCSLTSKVIHKARGRGYRVY